MIEKKKVKPNMSSLIEKRSHQDERDSYHNLKLIGKGGEGSVYLVERSSDKKFLACKVLCNQVDGTPIEVRMLRDILPAHDKIIRLVEFIQSPLDTQLYFEYCPGGDLESLISSYHGRGNPFPEAFLWHVYVQLAEALAFIHYGYNAHTEDTDSHWLSVIHRDIKPGNILLRPNARWSLENGPYLYSTIVLADFGLAISAQTPNRAPHSNYLVGTSTWQPPEIPFASPKGDVWALGAVIHALATGYPPIAVMPLHWAQTEENWERWTKEARAREISSVRGHYSSAMESSMGMALKRCLSERATSYDLFIGLKQGLIDTKLQVFSSSESTASTKLATNNYDSVFLSDMISLVR